MLFAQLSTRWISVHLVLTVPILFTAVATVTIGKILFTDNQVVVCCDIDCVILGSGQQWVLSIGLYNMHNVLLLIWRSRDTEDCCLVPQQRSVDINSISGTPSSTATKHLWVWKDRSCDIRYVTPFKLWIRVIRSRPETMKWVPVLDPRTRFPNFNNKYLTTLWSDRDFWLIFTKDLEQTNYRWTYYRMGLKGNVGIKI